jgi:hypothetical protein
MDGSERNTETPHHHPSAVKRERSAAGLALTRSLHNVWYGTISIGTPPKSFNGKFFHAFVTPTHSNRHLSPVQQRFQVSDFRQHHPLSRLIRPSDLFVPAVTGDRNCTSHPNLWDPPLSHTSANLNTIFVITLADGRIASGKQYTDNVTIAGLTVCL